MLFVETRLRRVERKITRLDTRLRVLREFEDRGGYITGNRPDILLTEETLAVLRQKQDILRGDLL